VAAKNFTFFGGRRLAENFFRRIFGRWTFSAAAAEFGG
jgi:hypothetical protein